MEAKIKYINGELGQYEPKYRFNFRKEIIDFNKAPYITTFKTDSPDTLGRK